MTENFDEQDFEQAHDLVKSRQKYFRRPKSSAEVLARLMARKGYAQNQTQNELDSVWKQIVGSRWGAKSKPGQLRNGTLEVVVTSSAINQQMEFQKKKFLAELHSKLPQFNIHDIRYRVGKFD